MAREEVQVMILHNVCLMDVDAGVCVGVGVHTCCLWWRNASATAVLCEQL